MADTDGDGINDGAEVIAGTNPLLSDSDSDGLSDSAEALQGTNPNESDSDKDGVSDGQEVSDGSNPLDRGSVVAFRGSSMCAEWNGYLGMYNIFEHLNQGGRKLRVRSTLYGQSGDALGDVDFGLRVDGQYDLSVHNMHGFKASSYGNICSTVNNGSPGELDGRMVFYKPGALPNRYDFAFAMPMTAGLKGRQYVPFNTYQPSLDPADAGNLAANWIQLTNLENNRQSGELVFFNREGTQILRQDVSLKAGGRIDYGAHDIAGMAQVGLVEWVPNDERNSLQLRNVRSFYSANLKRVISALQLEGAIGSGELLSVPVDTRATSAVLELSNTLNESVKVVVSFYAGDGEQARKPVTYKLRPHATHHLIVDRILINTEGIATIKASKRESVVVTAMQYRRTGSYGIQSAYGLKATEAIGVVMRGSYNTFLRQGCRLLLTNPTVSPVETTVNISLYDGSNLLSGLHLSVPAHGLYDYNLCAQVSANKYGVVSVIVDKPNSIYANVLRIGEDESYRFPTPLRE